MKKLWLLLLLLAAFAFSSCVNNINLNENMPSPPSSSTFRYPVVPNSTDDFSDPNNFAWDAQPITIDISGEIAVAAYMDNKLLFVINGILYQSNADGTGVTSLFELESETLKSIRFMCMDTDGNIWLASAGGAVTAWDITGTKLFEYAFARNTGFQVLRGGLFSLPNGNVGAIVSVRDKGQQMYVFDLTDDLPEKALEAASAIDNGIVEVGYAYLDEFALLTWDVDAIYSVNYDNDYALSEDRTEIVRWNEIGIYGTTAKVLGMSDENTVVVINDGILYALAKKQISTIINKTSLTLAVIGYVPAELNAVIASFNSSDEKYKVKIVAYDDILALNTEIVTGHTPDLMLTDSLPYNTFAAKGLFVLY
jgi:hypothetical protein